MDSKILSSLLIVGVASATGGVGLFAWFSDSAESTNNILDAAKVDLQINGAESIGAFISGTNMLPGECVSGSTTLKNVGDRTGSVLDLDIAIDYTSTDANMAKFLEVKDLDYGAVHTNLQGSINDANGNGWPDLADWDASNTATKDLTEPGAAGTTLSIQICFRTEAGNDLQTDSVTVDFDFLLGQSNAGAPDLS